MNTTIKLDSRLLLTISALLVAIWLPLTTFAKDMPDTDSHPALQDCEKTHGHLTFPTISDDQDRIGNVGFSETDPAAQQSQDVAVLPHQLSNRARQQFAGFTETDPSSQEPPNSATGPQAPGDSVKLLTTGFSESDPGVEDPSKLTDSGIHRENC